MIKSDLCSAAGHVASFEEAAALHDLPTGGKDFL